MKIFNFYKRNKNDVLNYDFISTTRFIWSPFSEQCTYVCWYPLLVSNRRFMYVCMYVFLELKMFLKSENESLVYR